MQSVYELTIAMNGPGDLGLGGRARDANEAVRRGRSGMPSYPQSQISDAQLGDLVAYLGTFSGGRFGR